MPKDSPDILQTIVARKREIIAEREVSTPIQQIQASIERPEPTRGFVAALKARILLEQPAVIAEVKKASPSKGVIRADFDPVYIADRYEHAGATCLSVLTDVDFFQGADHYIQDIRDRVALPILRKDFIVDPYQVYESRAIGADCILLIASVLDVEALHSLYELARSLDLDVLIEVHNRQELDAALTVSPDLIGINNRNLRTFDVSLDTTLSLLEHIPDDTVVITESGIRERSDVEIMTAKGVFGFLVGEAFMREPDPGRALEEIFSA